MNTNQYTQKTLEALQAAQQLAVEYQHNALEPEHLLHALASQEQGLIPQLLQKLNVDPGSFAAAVAEKLSALPRVSGSGRDPDKVYISQATEEQIDTFRKYVEEKGLTFVPISAATMQGVRELPGLVYNRLKDIPAVPVFAPEYKKPEAKAGGREFTIKRMEAHVWSVDAPWLEYILAGSNVDDYESLQYFQRQLGESGILDALVQKGVQENDTILIGEYQFDYIF